MNYGKHANTDLVNLFQKKPYQGQNPESAIIIFVGLDANYSELILDCFFDEIIEYQTDGIKFWNKYGKHHPFLLDDYPLPKNKDGVHYHRHFAKLKLDKSYATHISFVELLDIPTMGKTDEKIFFELLNPKHLAWLDKIFLDGAERAVFLSNSVIVKMKNKQCKGYFDWLPKKVDNKGFIKKVGNTSFYKYSHFSAYQIHSEIDEFKKIVLNTCSQQMLTGCS